MGVCFGVKKAVLGKAQYRFFIFKLDCKVVHAVLLRGKNCLFILFIHQ